MALELKARNYLIFPCKGVRQRGAKRRGKWAVYKLNLKKIQHTFSGQKVEAGSYPNSSWDLWGSIIFF